MYVATLQVIFIDEVDSICRCRSAKEEEHTRRIKTELLKQVYNYCISKYRISIYIYIYIYIFTWLNTAATISHFCKIAIATIQGWLLFENGVYCNIIMIVLATI